MFSQVGVLTSVGSGAGALKMGAALDQTGNLLGVDGVIMTPTVLIGKSDHPGGAKKKRFGATGVDHLFDYPKLAVEVAGGNGQAYKASTPGYLPGNGGGGFAGFGVGDPHSATFKEELDLTEAKEVAMRQGDVMPHFVQPEHFMYVDKTREAIGERLADMTEDYQREKLKRLYAQGFSEEEVIKYVEREREKAIEKAEQQPYNPVVLMEATLARAMPSRLREDYPNQSVAPGAIARRQDMTAFERAMNTGNPVAMKKKMEAKRHEQRIRAEVEHVEPVAKVEREDITSMMKRLAREAAADVHPPAKKMEEKHREAHHEEQVVKNRVIAKQEEMMMKALGREITKSPPMSVIPPLDTYARGGRDASKRMLEAMKAEKTKVGALGPISEIGKGGHKY